MNGLKKLCQRNKLSTDSEDTSLNERKCCLKDGLKNLCERNKSSTASDDKFSKERKCGLKDGLKRMCERKKKSTCSNCTPLKERKCSWKTCLKNLCARKKLCAPSDANSISSFTRVEDLDDEDNDWWTKYYASFDAEEIKSSSDNEDSRKVRHTLKVL